MWLDGLFMAQPFAAWYAVMSNHPEAFEDIANQFVWVARHTYDPRTGLYYHAWTRADSSAGRIQRPDAPPTSGEGDGLVRHGLVDVLDYFPKIILAARAC